MVPDHKLAAPGNKKLSSFNYTNRAVCIMDQACGQDGWISSEFFLAFLWTETKSWPTKRKNKNESLLSASQVFCKNLGFAKSQPALIS